MANDKITTDDLRGMLDDYSPEQQMEIDVQAIRDGAKTISDAAVLLKGCIADLSILVHQMQEATTLHISDESIMAIMKSGEETGNTVAREFKKNIEPIIMDARRRVNGISCPAIIGLFFCFLFLSVILFVGIIIYLNCILWNNSLIWRAVWFSGGIFVILVVLIIYMRHMEWV